MKKSLAMVLSLAAALCLLPHLSAQVTYGTLYSFPMGTSDSLDLTGLISSGGVLYGTTALGGDYGSGSVYSLQPPGAPGGAWTETTLYSFNSASGDGIEPASPPTPGPNGSLYGTTWAGANCTFPPGNPGCGGVYQLTPPASPGGAWTEKILYAFTGTNGDGSNPMSQLVLAPNGVIYGVTEYGGNAGNGTVYALLPPSAPSGAWTAKTIYSFGAPPDAANPNTLTLAQGVLYGTSLNLLGPEAGSVFQLTPPGAPGGTWTETILHTFTGHRDGCYPMTPPLVAPDGTIYGATYGGIVVYGYPGVPGDGTIFRLTQTAAGTWTKTVLYDLTTSNSWGPDSPLAIRQGAIYGTAASQYAELGGAFFQLQPPAAAGDGWTFNTLYTWDGNNIPGGPFVLTQHTLYGVTGAVEWVYAVPSEVYRLQF